MPVIQPITVLISKVRLTDIISVEQPQAHVKARHGLEEPGMLPANSYGLHVSKLLTTS